MEGVPLSDILSLIGAFHSLHGGLATCASLHCISCRRIPARKSGLGHYPELRDLLDSGDLIEATPQEAMYSIGFKHSIWFPADRDLAVCIVGKYACHGNELSVLVRDPNEAEFLCTWWN